MADIKYKICDRCGKRLSLFDLGASTVKTTALMMNSKYDLCRDCSDCMNKFLKNKPLDKCGDSNV